MQSIDAAAIGVAVHDGVVTLTGKLNTFAEKHAAERRGVKMTPLAARSERTIFITPTDWNTLKWSNPLATR